MQITSEDGFEKDVLWKKLWPKQKKLKKMGILGQNPL